MNQRDKGAVDIVRSVAASDYGIDVAEQFLQ